MFFAFAHELRLSTFVPGNFSVRLCDSFAMSPYRNFYA